MNTAIAILILFAVYLECPRALNAVISEAKWREQARFHREQMLDLLYPRATHPSIGRQSQKCREHLVASHPIYNFLHTYYRYSVNKLVSFSPGVHVQMEGVKEKDISAYLHTKSSERIPMDSTVEASNSHGHLCAVGISLLKSESGSTRGMYDPRLLALSTPSNLKTIKTIRRNLEILAHSSLRPPVYHCYGLHEWAMLYSGRKDGHLTLNLASRHQKLPLRVDQR